MHIVYNLKEVPYLVTVRVQNEYCADSIGFVFRFSGVAVLHTTMFLLTCENKFPIK